MRMTLVNDTGYKAPRTSAVPRLLCNQPLV